MYSDNETDKFQNLKKLFDEAEFLEKELEIESSAYFQPSVNERDKFPPYRILLMTVFTNLTQYSLCRVKSVKLSLIYASR